MHGDGHRWWQRILIITRSPRLAFCRPELIQILSLSCVMSAPLPHPCMLREGKQLACGGGGRLAAAGGGGGQQQQGMGGQQTTRRERESGAV
jgi:hypothetical protein